LLSWSNETAPSLLAGLFAVGCLTDFLDGVFGKALAICKRVGKGHGSTGR